ncbi:MAG: hypothetical protein SFU86_04840 [Pirellulaceae bacterium]|nr:hypothetical protein [Pirellulaceae bacterium]
MLRTFAVSWMTIGLVAAAPIEMRAELPTEPASDVRTALDELNQFIGNGANGQRWRSYLRTADLTAELEKPEGADREVLAAIIAKYSGRQNGLALPQFRAVRTALIAWDAALATDPATDDQPAATRINDVQFVAAQPTTPAGPLELPAALKEVKFEPITPEEVAQAKAELATAVSELEAMLNRSPRGFAAGWKKHLGWDNLTAVLEGKELPPPAVVNGLIGQFRANKNGLEMQKFVRVREALQKYSALAAASADPKLQDQFNEQLALLTKHLEAYEKNPASGDDALGAARAAGLLGRWRQAGGVLKAVSSRFGNPNLFGSASQRFAAVGIENDINQVTPVNDNILGTSLHGTAHMTGRTKLVVEDDPNAARFNILLSGVAVSNNVGYNGPVTVHTTGVTSIAGSKSIYMTVAGMAGDPAAVGASTNSTINSLCARCGLVEKIGWKRAGQQKGQAEAIGSSHAAARVAGQMNQQAGEMIAEQNNNYIQKFKFPLVRRGEFPEDLHFSSKSDRLFMRMLQTGPTQLAAPAAPPANGEHDLSVVAHESAVINHGEAVLAGYDLTDLELERIIRDDLKAEVPEELKLTLPDGTIDQEKDPWSIVFADALPVRAKFQNGGLWMAIRAKQFNRGQDPDTKIYEPAIKELVEIAADYTIERTEKGATLRRQGDVQVRFPARANPDQITLRDSPIVTFIRRKFRSMFKEEFVGEGLKFKGNWEKAGTLALKELESKDAWLVAGWDMPAPPAAAGETPVAPGSE